MYIITVQCTARRGNFAKEVAEALRLGSPLAEEEEVGCDEIVRSHT